MATPDERHDDVQSASSASASASPLGTSGELISLSDAESAGKSPDVPIFDVETPPPAPDFYHSFPAVPASTALDGEELDDHYAAGGVDASPRGSVSMNVGEEMDAETRRYIVQHGARAPFDPDRAPSPYPMRAAPSAPSPLVAVAGAEYDFPGDSDAVSPSADVPLVSLPTERQPSLELDPETLAREQRAYIIEHGVRSPSPFHAPPDAAPATAPSFADVTGKAIGPTDEKGAEGEKHTHDACDLLSSGDVAHTSVTAVSHGSSTSTPRPSFYSTRNMNPDVPQPVDAPQHKHFPSTNVEPGPTADTTQRLESVEAKEEVEARRYSKASLPATPAHRHFPPTNVEPGPTADTTQRLESVEAKEEVEVRRYSKASLPQTPAHRHFPPTNIEPGPTADITQRLESVEAKEEADYTQTVPAPAPAHRHFPPTNEEPGPTADTTQRLESLEAKEGAESAPARHQHAPFTNPERGAADTTQRLESQSKTSTKTKTTTTYIPAVHQHVAPARAIDPLRQSRELRALALPITTESVFRAALTGEETPKAEDKNPLERRTPATAPAPAPALVRAHMWWDGNLPRRIGTCSRVLAHPAIATLLGAAACGAYRVSDDGACETLALACAWFAAAAVGALRPGPMDGKGCLDLVVSTSASVLAAALLGLGK
ncbi:unnamed protein product [Cutaneotrichosporon oleaginosum]